MRRSLLLVAVCLLLSLPVAAQQQNPAPAAPNSGPIQFYPRSSLNYLGQASYDVQVAGDEIVVKLQHGDTTDTYRLKGSLIEINLIPLETDVQVLVVVYNKQGLEKWVLMLSEQDFMQYMREAAQQKGIQVEVVLDSPLNVARMDVSEAGFAKILGMPPQQ